VSLDPPRGPPPGRRRVGAGFAARSGPGRARAPVRSRPGAVAPVRRRSV